MKAQSVITLVSAIKNLLEASEQLNHIKVEGEISNLVRYPSGHWYFSLKDDRAKINCVMFRSANQRVHFETKDGIKVILSGSVSVYPQSGQLQLIATGMEMAGEGDLHQRYLQLRSKLNQEGYFKQEIKKPLIKYPMSIAVIAGQSSAALADVLQTLIKRWPIAKRVVYPSLVQGPLAPGQLITNLLQADKEKHDVIILARGGGSLEDLWAFNDEDLVKTIFSLNTPVVTGVGHEVDITLVDYVADVRGLTPTAAAQIVTPDQYEVFQILDTYDTHLMQLIRHKVLTKQQHLLSNQHYTFSNPKRLLHPYQMSLSKHKEKLGHFENRIQQIKSHLQQLEYRLQNKGYSLISTHQQKLKDLTTQLNNQQSIKLEQTKHQYALLIASLSALSPLHIMSKGYLLSYQDDQLIRSIKDIQDHKPLELQYYDGKIRVKKIGDEHD